MSPPEAGLTIRELLLEVRAEQESVARELRDTRHQVRADVRAVELRVIDLEQSRRDHDKRIAAQEALADKYVPMIDHLSSQEKITEAVETALEQSEHRSWTRRERALAIGLFLFAFVGAVGTVVSIIILLVT